MPVVTPRPVVPTPARRETLRRRIAHLVAIARAATVGVVCTGLAATVGLAADNVGLSSVGAQRFGRQDLPNANVGGDDQFAFAFAVGDFNGDGADDLATDHFGYELAVGDFDGDAFADLAIAVPQEDPARPEGSNGAIQMLYGSAVGLTADPDQVFYNPEDPASGSNTAFGLALAAGSFDGDAFDELAIGAFGDSTDAENAGSVYVLAGSPGGLLLQGGLRLSPDLILGTGASALFEYFGHALAVADFDGDGHADLAIGAPNEDESFLPMVGTATILYGALFADGFEDGLGSYWSSVVTGVP